MKQICISVAKQFSDAPGARYPEDGPDSGQEFYNKLLRPQFEQALNDNCKLVVDLDGTYGYATSFLSESFGRLAEDFGPVEVLARLELKSEEDPMAKSYAIAVINDPTVR